MDNNKQKILIIGSGGREHAIGWKVTQSARAGQIFFAPGNAGTIKIGTNVDISATDIPKLLDFAKKEKVDLTLALPDDPLALGIVDEFRKANLKIFGPTKNASQLEWSKSFSKNFMRRHNLPTAKFEIFNDIQSAKLYLMRQKYPIVIKANGLAFGKGVVICQSAIEAEETLENMMVKKIFGESGEEVVIEEFLIGPEISIHVLSDGKTYKIFPTAQDHKRIGEGNTGPNTGGMGVIGPLSFVDEEMMQKIEKEIVAPALRAMTDDGNPFEGILYPSLMLTKDGPKIIEFNARFGDPEAQVYMRLLDTDILDIFNMCVDKKLSETEIKWKKSLPTGRQVFACNIALASAGYPGSYEKGKEISGIEDAEMMPDIVVFHAGTKEVNKQLVTNGGRVLGVTATAETLEKALEKAYSAIKKISFEGMQYRKDIGRETLKLSKSL